MFNVGILTNQSHIFTCHCNILPNEVLFTRIQWIKDIYHSQCYVHMIFMKIYSWRRYWLPILYLFRCKTRFDLFVQLVWYDYFYFRVTIYILIIYIYYQGKWKASHSVKSFKIKIFWPDLIVLPYKSLSVSLCKSFFEISLYLVKKIKNIYIYISLFGQQVVVD